MRNHMDNVWNQLRQISPPKDQKDAIRNRISTSIQNGHSTVKSRSMFQWHSVLSACLLFLIFGGLLWSLFQSGTSQNAAQKNPNIENISWKLDEIVAKKTSEGYGIYRQNKPLQVGSFQLLTEIEMSNIIDNKPMFVQEELEDFPYPTNMYIEHTKRENVALRYHFFIPFTEGKWLYFTFDYQLLEFAEIFQIVATLEIEGKEPYIHGEPLYVKHGYNHLIYPVGIKPLSISPLVEKYEWHSTSFDNYVKEIETRQWKNISSKENSHTFLSGDGNQEVTITYQDDELIYEFIYHHQDE
jgi:hypothetical protein